MLDSLNDQRRHDEGRPAPGFAGSFQVPPRLRHFVSRPEVSDRIKAQLLDETGTPGVLTVIAIHDMGVSASPTAHIGIGDTRDS